MDIQKILTKLRITELNEMQQHAAEAILGSDGDVVLLSPTGSGKTLAYLYLIGVVAIRDILKYTLTGRFGLLKATLQALWDFIFKH